MVVVHGWEHFELSTASLFFKLVSMFPGVPIFFVVSGYLVSASFERSFSLSSYLRNRILRIYPGLWVCFVISLASVFLFYRPNLDPVSFTTWVIAQLSLFQFYNPDFLRGYGVGVLNGSLWTIPVEIQFYVILPVAYMVVKRLGWRPWLVMVGMLALILVNQAYLAAISDGKSLILKVVGITAVPYLYMFLFGVLIQRRQDLVVRFLSGRFAAFGLAYLIIEILAYSLGWNYGGNAINPLSALVLSLAVISFAYSHTSKLGSILRGNDISYGMYIYHMIWVNVLVQHPLTSPWGHMGLMMLLTVISAFLSWRFVEKPALALKAYSVKFGSKDAIERLA